MSAPAPGWLVRQLPVAMAQDDFTARFTAIFEEVADTLVHSTDTIGRAADLSITPDPLVRWLGGWIGAPADPEEGRHDVRERDWVRAQARALSARGTRTGLQELLAELAGGYPVEIVDGGGVHRDGQCPDDEPGWVQVRMPLPGRASPAYVRELICAEVPIGVRVDLVVVPTPGEDPGSFTGPLPEPPEPEPEPVIEQMVPVPGGPYFWDGGIGDVHHTLGADPSPPAVAGSGRAAPPGAVRRLPGTGGRAVRAGRLCPACSEPADRATGSCPRCGSPMVLPPPDPTPVAEEEPEPFLWADNSWGEPEPRNWLLIFWLLGGLLLVLAGAGLLVIG